jgi:hypothetical protein
MMSLLNGGITGLDVGCAKLIREGKVKVKQGVEAASFTEDSLVFTDGSSLPADVVIYALALHIFSSTPFSQKYSTSYTSVRDDMRGLFTDEVIDRTSPLWGIDEEGEIRGCYHASGYPGVSAAYFLY